MNRLLNPFVLNRIVVPLGSLLSQILIVAVLAACLLQFGCAVGYVNQPLPFSAAQINSRGTNENATNQWKLMTATPVRNLQNNGNENTGTGPTLTGGFVVNNAQDKVVDTGLQGGKGNLQDKTNASAVGTSNAPSSNSSGSPKTNSPVQPSTYTLTIPLTGGGTGAFSVPTAGALDAAGVTTATLAPLVQADFTKWWQGSKGTAAQVPTMISNSDWAAYLLAKQATPTATQ